MVVPNRSGNTGPVPFVIPSARITPTLRSMSMNRMLLLLALLAIGRAHATTLDPPDLRCVSYAPVDQVTLTWTPPADPTGVFDHYSIYVSNTEVGPYTLVTTVNGLASTSVTVNGTGADGARRYFRITSVSNEPPPNESVESNTLASIFVEVGQSTPLGQAAINWNTPHIPPLAQVDSMALYLEYPVGTLTFVDSVGSGQTFYQFPISICEDSLSFRLTYRDGTGCTATSTIDGATFRDVTPPPVPITVAVSVDTTTNQTIVTWQPSPAMDTDGYIIVYDDGTTNLLIDTVFGRLNNTYTWPLSDAGANAEGFRVAAFDTCWSGTPATPNTSAANSTHRTMFADADYDQCANRITVGWTPYVGWPVVQYELFRQVDGAAPVPVGTYPTPQAAILQTVQPDRTYCYVAKATGAGAGQVSLSNKVCRSTAYPDVPQWNYLRYATVEGPTHIRLVDSLDLSAPAKRYRLERSSNGGDWDQVQVSLGGGPVIVFNDHDVDTDARSYQYRVMVDDSCGYHVATSNLATSIHVQVTPDLNGYNTVRWNGYVQWAGQVLGYLVYRSASDGPYQLIANVPGAQWEYIDLTRDHSDGNGKFCYYVEALEQGNPAGIDALSRSNLACAVQEEAVWIPNAFIVGGANPEFQPVLVNVETQAYELTIFNRWGQQIWTTADRYQAWNGRVGDVLVPQGVYAYLCAYVNGAGKRMERHGTVTFIHAQP